MVFKRPNTLIYTYLWIRISDSWQYGKQVYEYFEFKRDSSVSVIVATVCHVTNVLKEWSPKKNYNILNSPVKEFKNNNNKLENKSC